MALTCWAFPILCCFPKASEALDLLAEAVPVERFPSLRRDLAALYAGYYIAELLTDLTDLHDPHPKLFDAARITLRHLGDADLRSRRILRFELACLRELGLMPSLDRCAQCGGDVEPQGGKVSFGLASGGVLCEACRPGQPHVVVVVGRRPRGDSRPGQPGQTPGASWTFARDASRRPERRSGRSSVMSWAIVRDSGPYWECDPMVRGDRDLRGTCADCASHRGRRFLDSPISRGVAAGPPCRRRAVAWLALAPSVLLRPAARASSARSRSGGPPTTETWSRGRPRTRWPTSPARPARTTLLDRWLTPRRSPAAKGDDKSSTLILGSDGWRPMAKPAKDPEAEAEFDAAHKLFQQGKLAEAEKAVRQDRQEPQGHARGRDGQYYLAETQFQRQKYVDAHDSFELLHEDYPATEYIDKLVSREYEIAQLWFAQADPKAPKEKRIPWYGRFDGRLPFIDTQGSALKALEHVRQNDPDRPAGRRRRDGDRRVLHEASTTSNPPRSTTTNSSPSTTRAPCFKRPSSPRSTPGSKATSAPNTTRPGLEKARAIIRKTMEDLPRCSRPATEELYHTLDVINDAEAEKTYQDGALLQEDRQGRLRRVLLRQDPPALAQQPLGRQGQGRAGSSSPRCRERRRSPARSSSRPAPPIPSAAAAWAAAWAAWAAWVAWAWAAWAWECRMGGMGPM